MADRKNIQVILMREALDFIATLPRQAGGKVYDNIHRIEAGERNAELFKKLEGSEIWEFRTLFAGIQYRLFAFWDTQEQAFVIATHGIVKKTQKTPAKEISKAERIRQEYFNKKTKQA